MELWVILLLALFNECRSQTLPVDGICRHLPCYWFKGSKFDPKVYKGKATVRDGKCFCECIPGYTGQRCEYEIKESGWPQGPYATPMSIYGCPEHEHDVTRYETLGNTGWKTGYLKMTFTQSLNEYSSRVNKSMIDPSTISLLGPFDDCSVQMNFCYKTNDTAFNRDSSVQWLRGNYRIHRAEGTCPAGFSDSLVSLKLPPLRHYDLDGGIPDILVKVENESTTVLFHMCDKEEPFQGKMDPSDLSAFILMKDTSKNIGNNGCQAYPGLDVKEEELPLVSLKYCTYIPSIRETMMNEPLGITWFFDEDWARLPQDFTTTINGALKDVQLAGGSRGIYPIMAGASCIKREKPWIHVDLFYTRIFSIITKMHKDFPASQLIQRDMPLVSCSSKKWTFLHNGGIQSNQYCAWAISDPADKYWYLRRPCSQRCRYLTLHGENSLVSESKAMMFFSYFQELTLSFGYTDSNLRSNSDMGMIDNHIENSQISASSYTPSHPPHYARPHLQGWCSNADDTEPYLQINLLLATEINGIRVYNWFSENGYFVNNTFKSRRSREGISWFAIQYGFNGETLSDYTKSDGTTQFWISTSQPFAAEQDFVFPEPVLASVIRIYPSKPLETAVCVRFEVLGNSRTAIKGVSCDENEHRFWISMDELFVSLQPPNLSSLPSLSDCKRSCRANENCTAVMFNGDTESCFQFTAPTKYNYVKRTADDNSTLHQLMCTEEYPESEISHTIYSDKGLVLSPGYPFGTSGMTYSIMLTFPETNAKFMHLIFTNFSIAKYQENSEQTFDDSCGNKIKISESHYVPTVVETVLPVRGQLVFPFEWNQASIHVKSCTQESPAINFRIIPVASDTLLCKSTHSPKIPLCNGKDEATISGLLASNSFLGLTYRNMRHEFWRISGVYQHVELKIIEMLVRCNSASVLHVEHTDKQLQQFCNGRRQIDRSVSMNTELVIHFHSEPGNDPREGFVAEYRKQRFDSVITQNMIAKKDVLRLNHGAVELHRQSEWDTSSWKWIPVGEYEAGVLTDPVARVMCRHMGYSGSFVRHWTSYSHAGEAGIFSGLECEGSELNLFDCENGDQWKSVYTMGNIHLFFLECGPPPTDVCRQRKCYYFFRNEHPDSHQRLSAAEADDYCEQTYGESSTLVQVTDEAEAMFIKAHFIFWFINVSSLRPDVSNMGHAYIGLIRYVKNGELEEKWTNGNAVSYSEWIKDHPGDGLSKGGCTRMGINTFHGLNSWEAIPCDSHEADYFVCEIDHGKGTDQNLHSQLVHVEETNNNENLKNQNFLCESGEFISHLFRCDGLKDCLDGTDELDCLQSKRNGQCHEGYIQCRDGECIPISAWCDYVSDCNDASDEICEFPPCNNVTEYKCDNSQCIGKRLRCDTVPDCLDGSDEQNCDSCPEEMLMCWDKRTKCVSKEKVCDGFTDCYDGRDERNCEITCLKSCRDWWLKGYRQSGEFCIDENRVECNFDSEGIIKTIYYDIEVQAPAINNHDSIDVGYGSLDFVNKLVNELSCKQSIKNQCRPPTSIIAKAEGIGNNTAYWDCFCVRWIFHDHTISKLEPCSDETTKEVAIRGREWLEGIALKLKERQGFPITKIKFDISPQPYETLTFESIVCEEAFNQTEFDSIVCKRGNIVSSENRCLYQIDPNGDVRGCADMTHLRSCEDFQCPDGYVKCPKSYCIPVHFLCDGRRHCPKGNDEINCWCRNTSSDFTMIFPAKAEHIYTAMLIMANHLHQETEHRSNVRLLKYTLSTKGQNKTDDEPTLEDSSVAEVRYYDHQKYEQLKDPHFSGSIQDVFQHVLLENNSRHTVHFLFVDKDTILTDSFNEWFAVNSSFLEIYVVFVGEDGGDVFLGDVVRKNFPEGTSYINVRDAKHPATFAFETLSSLCPAPETPVCTGLYRCHASRICLEIVLLCDGVAQCPHQDDERLCSIVCPEECKCTGFSVDCSVHKATKETLSGLSNNTRSLDLNTNNLQDMSDAAILPFMLKLNMSHCKLRRIPKNFIKEMKNLMYLDLSFNEIDIIHEGDLSNKQKLEYINLGGNMDLRIIKQRAFEKLINIRSIIIRSTKINVIEPWTFSQMNLELLDLSNNDVVEVKESAFGKLQAKVLNISGNKVSRFPKNMLKDISKLQLIESDAYKFCCIKPIAVRDEDCNPQRDEFSSCEDLMRNEPLRFLLWLVGISALIGNVLSLVYRLKFDRKKLKLGYGIFVTNLAISDFLMGLYLFIIATADIAFRGEYIFADEWWRNSHWCKLAGVLATMSSEASVLFMCFITLDRLIVIKYPFGTIRFQTKSAVFVSIGVWMIVSIIACVPLIWTSYFQNRFYSQSGVCLALPLTKKHTEEAGSAYSIAIFIGFNFVTFSLIGVGQYLLYREIKMSARQAGDSGQNRQRDLKVARNLFLVVMTDFLCWFPIGLVGLLALGGLTIPGVVYSWAAVVILPVNSALNPFLYTFSVILGKKKSIPEPVTSSIKEQVKPVEMTIDNTAKLIEVWNGNWILQRPEMVYRCRKTVSLSRYVMKFRITPTDVLKISYDLINAIFQLHEYRLITNGVCRHDVRLMIHRKKMARAVMKLSPTFMISKRQKRQDIADVGEIVAWLLQKINKNKK